MYLPPVNTSTDWERPEGHSYGGAVVVGGSSGATLALLRGLRFTGWVAPPSGGQAVVLGDPGIGVVARDRLGIIEVGAGLADATRMPVLVFRVRRDRQLVLVAWDAGGEIGRYSSDPSLEPGASAEVLAEPYGAELAQALAELFGRPDAAEELGELLDDELDPDSVSESERLGRVLRLLGLPRWIVGAGELPHRLPTGPRVSELVRVRAGATGLGGRLMGALVRRARRRHVPPWAIADPPTGSGVEPWMLGL